MSRVFVEEYITIHANLLGVSYAEYEKLSDQVQGELSQAAYAATEAAWDQIAKGYLSQPGTQVPSVHPGDEFMVQQYELCSTGSAEMECEYMAHSIGIYTEQQLNKATVQNFVDYAVKIWAETAAAHKVPFQAIHVTRQKAFRETENTVEPING